MDPDAWYGKRTLFRLKIHNTSTVDVENTGSPFTFFHIYPNPAHAVLNLESSLNTGFRYQVLDLSGREIMNGPVTDANRTTLDVFGLHRGLYILQAGTSNVRQTTKFVIY